MTLRAQNYLNTLSQIDAAIAAGASLLAICPADDSVAAEVIDGLGDRVIVPINGVIYVRIAEGDKIYDQASRVVSVTPRQFRLALLGIGINPDQVLGLLTALPEPTKSAALIEWEYAIGFRRDHALMAQMGAAMGKTESDIDAIFALAATL
jgi:hypothetical protein